MATHVIRNGEDHRGHLRTGSSAADRHRCCWAGALARTCAATRARRPSTLLNGSVCRRLLLIVQFVAHLRT